jgi:flagellar biosynthesis/type III secretory pathway chaperone
MATAVADKAGGVAERDGAASLARALSSELALLEELKERLVDQRSALAADDTNRLEQVVQQISRTLLTLREARRQRTLLVEMVLGRADASLAEAAAAATGADGRRLTDLCGRIHAAAVAANRELLINQTAIRRAIESGERFLQYLLSTPGQAASGEPPVSGLLLNQRA